MLCYLCDFHESMDHRFLVIDFRTVLQNCSFSQCIIALYHRKLTVVHKLLNSIASNMLTGMYWLLRNSKGKLTQGRDSPNIHECFSLLFSSMISWTELPPILLF